ncbi:serine/threonine kinase [Aureococcus anophagefferens]|nr:serine/threonine kinase [Aureococcus anophagefferens]
MASPTLAFESSIGDDEAWLASQESIEWADESDDGASDEAEEEDAGAPRRSSASAPEGVSAGGEKVVAAAQVCAYALDGEAWRPLAGGAWTTPRAPRRRWPRRGADRRDAGARRARFGAALAEAAAPRRGAAADGDGAAATGDGAAGDGDARMGGRRRARRAPRDAVRRQDTFEASRASLVDMGFDGDLVDQAYRALGGTGNAESLANWVVDHPEGLVGYDEAPAAPAEAVDATEASAPSVLFDAEAVDGVAWTLVEEAFHATLAPRRPLRVPGRAAAVTETGAVRIAPETLDEDCDPFGLPEVERRDDEMDGRETAGGAARRSTRRRAQSPSRSWRRRCSSAAAAGPAAERDVLDALAHRKCAFVAKLRFAFQSPSKLFLAMDYYPAGSLDAVLEPLLGAGRRARPRAGELAAALGRVHELCVLHRDLKPSNVLVDAAGHVALSDFGLATRVGRPGGVVRKRSFAGTVNYAAPELLLKSRETYGGAVDCWALGCLLHEMLAGAPPFRAPTARETFARIAGPEPAPPPGDVDEDCATTLAHLLEKDPGRRLAAAKAPDSRWCTLDFAALDREPGPLASIAAVITECAKMDDDELDPSIADLFAYDGGGGGRWTRWLASPPRSVAERPSDATNDVWAHGGGSLARCRAASATRRR